jgi:hypothetical protein
VHALALFVGHRVECFVRREGQNCILALALTRAVFECDFCRFDFVEQLAAPKRQPVPRPLAVLSAHQNLAVIPLVFGDASTHMAAIGYLKLETAITVMQHLVRGFCLLEHDRVLMCPQRLEANHVALLYFDEVILFTVNPFPNAACADHVCLFKILK